MNFIVNIACNAFCDYCFAKEDILSLKKDEMSIEEFKEILQFVSKSHYEKIRILGGEPTLHRDFKEIINLSEKYKKPIEIFTNGFVCKDTVKFLEEKNVKFTVNFSARKFTEEPKEKLAYFLKKLGPKCALGINYTNEFDIKEINEVIKTVKKYKLISMIRLGIASPVYNLSNNYFDFIKNKIKINKDLRELSKRLFKHKIKIIHDCSYFPVCAIEDETLSLIKKYNDTDIKTLCINRGALDILPGKEVIRCFAFSTLMFHLERFKNIEEIKNHFSFIDQFLFKHVTPEMCKTCKFNSFTCQSGCLGNRFRLLKKLPDNSKYKFSGAFYFFKDTSSISLIDINNPKRVTLLKSLSLEIFNLLLKDLPEAEIIRELSKRYSQKEKHLRKDMNIFLQNLRKDRVIV